MALDLSEAELCSALDKEQRMTLPELMIVLDRVIGAARISVGVASNFADVYQFVRFARGFLDQES